MDMRTLEELEIGGRDRPRTPWMKDDLPTPVEPIIAMLKLSMLSVGCDWKIDSPSVPVSRRTYMSQPTSPGKQAGIAPPRGKPCRRLGMGTEQVSKKGAGEVI